MKYYEIVRISSCDEGLLKMFCLETKENLFFFFFEGAALLLRLRRISLDAVLKDHVNLSCEIYSNS